MRSYMFIKYFYALNIWYADFWIKIVSYSMLTIFKKIQF